MIDIHWRAKSGTTRETLVIDVAREYGCEPNTHLFDRLLEDRHTLTAERKRKIAEIAERERLLAEEKRKIHGG
jgi:hypothetical protein